MVATEAPGPVGGMQRYVWKIAEGLSKRGHRVTVFVRDGSENLGLRNADVRAVLSGCVEEDKKNLGPWEGRLDLWHAMNAGYAWLAGYSIPCVVSIYGNDFLKPWIPVSRRRLPLVGSRLNYLLRVEASKKLLRDSCSKVRRILAISEYSKQVFLERHPECAGKTRVVYGGVDLSWVHTTREARADERPIHLITVCRLEDRRKNVDLVLRALARLSKRFLFDYSIVGEGPLRPELEDLTHRLGLDQRVHFLGRIGDDELADRLGASDLFVLVSSRNPSSFEGFGLVYLEANAAGIPVLAAKVGGAPEAVEAGVSGYFVDEISVEGIAATLVQFLSGTVRFDAESCMAHAKRFPWQATVDAVESVYGEVLATPPPDPERRVAAMVGR
jgi:glycosyltransferase involved in cell wall biosynthesis